MSTSPHRQRVRPLMDEVVMRQLNLSRTMQAAALEATQVDEGWVQLGPETLSQILNTNDEYLDAMYGQVFFGGVGTLRYTSDFVAVPIVDASTQDIDLPRTSIGLTSVSFDEASGRTELGLRSMYEESVLLDTGASVMQPQNTIVSVRYCRYPLS
ncbi:MAG: hypothetical protein Q9213_004252 [Squamulea squamosa]